MSRKLRFGLVGCGEIGLQNAQAIVTAKNAELVMCADVDLEVTRELGERHGVPYATENEALFASDDVDAVFLCTPPFTHAPLTIEAARHGKHIVTEKPMSVGLAEADQMIAACQAAGVKLAVCFCQRYQPHIQRAKALVEQGILGEVLGTHLLFHDDREESYWTGGYSGRVRTDWRGCKGKSGGGILAANLVHNLDIARYLTGLEVVSVCSTYATLDTPVEVEDSLAVSYQYDNGAIGSLSASTCVRGTEYLFDFRIWGTDGHLSLSQPVRFYSVRAVRNYKPGRWHELKVKGANARVEFVQRFADAVLNGASLPVSEEEGRVIQALVEAIYVAGKRGQVVRLE